MTMIDGAPPSLTVVIPAYNEARRIQATLEDTLAYLREQPYAGNVILVDDGSTDDTVVVATAIAEGAPELTVLTIPHSGKAVAVRVGMLAATGDQIAFMDADLATPLTYIADLRSAVAGSCDIAIGSREGLGASRIGEPGYRHVMGRVFNWLVRLTVLPGLQDTQCGLKLFKREVVGKVLSRALLYVDAGSSRLGPRVTAFDVEVLFIARRLGYRVCPVPVVWSYGEQSKVHPVRDTWQNVGDVLRVRLNAWRGRYPDQGKPSIPVVPCESDIAND